MKTSILIPVLILASQVSYGQNKNLRTAFAAKLYNQTSWQKQSEPFASGIYSGSTTRKEAQLLHPTAAFRVRNKRNNFHEIELNTLELGKENIVSSISPGSTPIPLAGGKTTTTHIALRYEYIINFLKNKDSRFMPAIGISAMPYYQQTAFTPVLATEYPAATSRGGVKAYVIPRINYAISSKLFVDLNIPICIADMYFERNSKTNPNLLPQDQKNSTGNFDGIPKLYSIRIGVGLNI